MSQDGIACRLLQERILTTLQDKDLPTARMVSTMLYFFFVFGEDEEGYVVISGGKGGFFGGNVRMMEDKEDLVLIGPKYDYYIHTNMSSMKIHILQQMMISGYEYES